MRSCAYSLLSTINTHMHFRRAYAPIFFAALFVLGATASAQSASTQPTAPAQPAPPNASPTAPAAAPPAATFSPSALQPFSPFPLLFFRQPLVARPRFDDGAVIARGFRPFYVEKRDANNRLLQLHILYPLFNWRAVNDDGCRWDILTLINHERSPATRPTAEHPSGNQFDIWPFYFSNNTGDPATSYRAVFPIHGSVSQRLLQDRLGWFLFPIYGWSERNGTTTRAILWPIFRRSTGAGVDGWKVWPLAGHETKTNLETGAPLYKNTFALWPIYSNNTTWNRDDPDAAPARALALLPFYYRESAPGFRSDSYMLLFGRTRRTAPYEYSENRYLWPLFIQGRGPRHRVSRWAPFHTYSRHDNREKTWVLWPLWNQSRLDDGVSIYNKKRLLYFIYNDVTQTPSVPPEATPAQKAAIEVRPPARKTSLWPFFTYWTDGRGRKQLQALSPFEVFFPRNEPVRLVWAPLFALYRHEQEAPGHVRHDFLWNLITHRREPDLREFHLGPLYSGERIGNAKRRALLGGLIGVQKIPPQGWRPFAFNFKNLRQQLAETSQATPAPTAPQTAATPAPPPPRPYPKVRLRR